MRLACWRNTGDLGKPITRASIRMPIPSVQASMVALQRDPKTGEVVIGQQYQNHNPRPGPVYAGGGYTPINNALRQGERALKPLLDKYPDLANDVSTGGASP